MALREIVDSELCEPLRRANETLSRIELANEVNYHDQNDQNEYELNYLCEKNPDNKYISVFYEYSVTRFWKYPSVFDLDGLIYDETENIFYIVEFYHTHTEERIEEAKEKVDKFRQFLQMKEPLRSERKTWLRWDAFFGELGVLAFANRTKTKIYILMSKYSNSNTPRIFIP